jgi:adenine-specific DNA-methyltransferase
MKKNLLLFLERIKGSNIKFSSLDFTKFDFSKLGQDDFVYCDPPYLITTGSYNDGARGFKDWTDAEEKALYEILDELNEKGVKFALSNVLSHKGAKNESLIKWSKKHKVIKLKMDYSSSSHNTKRGESQEALIVNYKP